MLTGYGVAKYLIERAATLILCFEDFGLRLEGPAAFSRVDIVQGYWKTPLHASARELFTAVTTGILWMSTRVPQGVLDSTAYLQAIVVDALNGGSGECVACGWMMSVFELGTLRDCCA